MRHTLLFEINYMNNVTPNPLDHFSAAYSSVSDHSGKQI